MDGQLLAGRGARATGSLRDEHNRVHVHKIGCRLAVVVVLVRSCRSQARATGHNNLTAVQTEYGAEYSG